MLNRYIPLGPIAEFPVYDSFTYEDVRESHCVASVSKNVCEHLVNKAHLEEKRYVAVCLPAYNEELDEMIKTLISLMKNFEFMQRKVRIHDDEVGKALSEELVNTIPVIVPIFDGTRALSGSMREWISQNFPMLLDGLDGPSTAGEDDVHISCARWWYYCKDVVNRDKMWSDGTSGTHPKPPNSTASTAAAQPQNQPTHSSHEQQEGTDDLAPILSPSGPTQRFRLRPPQHHPIDLEAQATSTDEENANDQFLYFYMCPIVKRSNHRKHNSHQWFFDAICEGLDDTIKYAFLTDCGTSFDKVCISKLLYELHFRPDIVGVTARQRVDTPNEYFRPCEDSPFWLLRGDHSKPPSCWWKALSCCIPCLRRSVSADGKQPTCWRCWITYFLSPCPLQGFEFEASLILSSAMFNLVEALPVMPGPCQLVNWQIMKECRVVDEYFNLLFEGETVKRLPRLPDNLKLMQLTSPTAPLTVSAHRSNPAQQLPPARSSGLITTSSENMNSDSQDDGFHLPRDARPLQPRTPRPSSNAFNHRSTPPYTAVNASRPSEGVVSAPPNTQPFTFTEFLRVNMRLAEDRILSFVSVFCTGHGTIWVPGATFYYQPEVQWNTLLTQRRRWLNGTYASFFFFFVSKRARARIHGGLFDAHKASRNERLVNLLWCLQMIQLCLVFITPAIFGSAGYLALRQATEIWDFTFGWIDYEVYSLYGFQFRVNECWTIAYVALYALWSFGSFFAPRGKISETICQLMAIWGFLYLIPVYFTVWYHILFHGADIVGGIVITNLVVPMVLSMTESLLAATLYTLYLPWFLILVNFFIVCIPAYSFARLWDTTWGNRATGKDSAINESAEWIMKFYNFCFLIALVSSNAALTWCFIQMFSLGYRVIVVFMFVIFCPMFIQLFFSLVYLMIVLPLNIMHRQKKYEVWNMYQYNGYNGGGTAATTAGAGNGNTNTGQSGHGNKSINNAIHDTYMAENGLEMIGSPKYHQERSSHQLELERIYGHNYAEARIPGGITMKSPVPTHSNPLSTLRMGAPVSSPQDAANCSSGSGSTIGLYHPKTQVDALTKKQQYKYLKRSQQQRFHRSSPRPVSSAHHNPLSQHHQTRRNRTIALVNMTTSTAPTLFSTSERLLTKKSWLIPDIVDFDQDDEDDEEEEEDEDEAKEGIRKKEGKKKHVDELVVYPSQLLTTKSSKKLLHPVLLGTSSAAVLQHVGSAELSLLQPIYPHQLLDEHTGTTLIIDHHQEISDMSSSTVSK